MSKQVEHALRDLVLLVVGAVLPVLTAVAATKGLFHITLNDLEKVAGAAVTGVTTWALVFITPITRKYGVGSPD